MEKFPRPTLFDFHGVYMTKYFTENWDNIQNFKARPDDIVIATYPKAGGYICPHFSLLPINCVCSGLKRMYSSQELHGFPASWIYFILGRHLRSVRLPSLFMKECHFWRSIYPMEIPNTQVIPQITHYKAVCDFTYWV